MPRDSSRCNECQYREKRIADLEKDNAEWKTALGCSLEERGKLFEKIEHLREENAELIRRRDLRYTPMVSLEIQDLQRELAAYKRLAAAEKAWGKGVTTHTNWHGKEWDELQEALKEIEDGV